MKKYQSHKIVEAAQIMGYTALGNYVNVEADNADGYERVSVPGDFFARGNPGLGDYLVRYQPDGYLSWSPRAAFEDGYTLVEDKPGTWQERAVLELNELTTRINGLRKALIGGTPLGGEITALLQAQYQAMVAYHDALSQRLRLCGVIDTETLPVVRETPAAVEVTVSAPAGKRAQVSLDSGSGAITRWTVTEGQSQSWAVIPGEGLGVSSENTSTVAHKRPAG